MRGRVRGDPERLAPARPALGYLSRCVNPPPLPDLPINEALPALAEALAGRRSVLLELRQARVRAPSCRSSCAPALARGAKDLDARTATHSGARGRRPHGVSDREPVGQRVGFRTRLETRVSRETRIEVVTEGILTRMLQEDSASPESAA